MNDDNTTGKQLEKRLDQVSPNVQAAMLLDLLENNPAGMDAVITNRQWTRGKGVELNSGWPVQPGDHKTESTKRGRSST